MQTQFLKQIILPCGTAAHGLRWPAMAQGCALVGGAVNAIALNGTTVYVGGAFTSVKDTSNAVKVNAPYLAQWNGFAWSAIPGTNSAFDGPVYALTYAGGNLYAGGNFSSANGIAGANNIVAWNSGTQTWSALGNNSINTTVYSIAVDGANVYVGGYLYNVSNGGIPIPTADYVAKWNGSSWSALGSNGAGNGALNSFVYALAVIQNDLWVGGDFLDVNNNGTQLKAADKLAVFGLDLPPTVSSVTRASANPTGASSVDFLVTFSEAVNGVDTTDFDLITSGVTGASLVVFNDHVFETTYTVSVNTGTGNGTIRLDVLDNDTIVDAGTNSLSAGHTSGEVYTIEKTAPTVTSSVRASTNSTSASSVNYTVTFSESVTGVNTADFSLTTTGVSSAAVSGISGSGSSYTVAVNTGVGSGTLRLDVLDDDSIIDAAGNPLAGGFTVGESYTVSKSPVFDDVPFDYWANSYIERLYKAGVTGGCGTGIYCPDATVTRAQMAVFLLKGMHGSSYTPPAVGVSTGFGDVATDYWAAAWIKQLAAEGVTSGCGNGNYCPDSVVTRAQMAIFLLKARNGSSYTPPAVGVSTGFNDVATDAFGAAFIKQLVADGITAGCGNSNYCPNDSVTRAQMAVFLVRAFNLP
ncbi:MAG: S-layer homology domain-containing protein [Anaerolineales bacterium]|nr:S-layer homology domain-containing protein [Anaerolineales bacterium]